MTVPGGFTAGDVLTAADMNLLPGGIVATTSGGTSSRGYVTGLAAQTVNAGVTADVTSSSMTFTAVSGRLYRYQGFGFASSTSASGLATIQITNSANTILQRGVINLTNTAGEGHFYVSYVFTASGSTTVKMRLVSTTGNTTIYGANTLGSITLEDIGDA